MSYNKKDIKVADIISFTKDGYPLVMRAEVISIESKLDLVTINFCSNPWYNYCYVKITDIINIIKPN